MVLEGRRDHPGDVAAEVGALLTGLSAGEDGDIGDRQVGTVTLPLGPAARVRFLTRTDVGDGTRLAVDATQVWVPLPGGPAMVVVSGSTPCLHLGDELAAVVDQVAASLRPSGGRRATTGVDARLPPVSARWFPAGG